MVLPTRPCPCTSPGRVLRATRLGLALLDRDDPTRVIARGNEWVFGPSASYERSGDVADVVFPCGSILDDDGDTIRMYYGAADSVVCLATASVEALLDHVMTPCADRESSHPPGLAPAPAIDSGYVPRRFGDLDEMVSDPRVSTLDFRRSDGCVKPGRRQD